MAQKFSNKEAIQFGWDSFKNRIGFWIGLLIITAIVYFIPNIIAKFIESAIKNGQAGSFFYNFTFILRFSAIALISPGLIGVSLRLYEKKEVKLTDFFSYFSLFFKFLIAWLLYDLIVFAGILLLIVPGIIWAIKFQFFGYFVVDRQSGPIEALKKSAAITEDTKENLLAFDSILFVIYMLGVLSLMIGLFVAIPVVLMATVFVYHKLLEQSELADGQVQFIQPKPSQPEAVQLESNS